MLTKSFSEECKALYEEGLSLREVGANLRVSKDTVMVSLLKNGFPLRSKRKAAKVALKRGKVFGHEFHNVKEDFFKSWTREMAYVLGYLFADGSLLARRRGANFSFCGKEKELVEKIGRLLEYKEPARYSFNRGYGLWTININRVEMVEDLKRLGFSSPRGAAMKFPEIPLEYLRDFIRGYFEGDGCVRVYCRDRLEVNFASCSREFLGRLEDLLRRIGMSHRKLYNAGLTSAGNMLYKLAYRKQPDIRSFCRFLYSDTPDEMVWEKKREKFRRSWWKSE